MINKIIISFILLHANTAIIFCQVAMPTGGAVDVLRKESFSVDLLTWIVGILIAVIIYQEAQKKKKDKEIADLKDNQIKKLEDKLMRHESK